MNGVDYARYHSPVSINQLELRSADDDLGPFHCRLIKLKASLFNWQIVWVISAVHRLPATPPTS